MLRFVSCEDGVEILGSAESLLESGRVDSHPCCGRKLNSQIEWYRVRFRLDRSGLPTQRNTECVRVQVHFFPDNITACGDCVRLLCVDG